MRFDPIDTGTAVAPALLIGRAFVTLAFCAGIAMLDGADTQSMAIAAPLMARDLAIGPGSLGLIFSASLLGAALGALVGGALADRFGPNRLLVACTLMFGSLQLATAYADHFGTLLLLRAGAGLGLGGATPCFLALAAASIPAAFRARVLGLIWAFFPIGAFVGGFVNGWLVQNRSWHAMFFYGGAVPIAIALLLSATVREVAVTRTVQGSLPSSRHKLYDAFVNDRMLRHRTMLLCAVFFAAFATLAGIVIWMPSLMVKNGFAPAQGGAVLSWHALGALVSIATGGFLLERFGARPLIGGLLISTLLLPILAISLTAFWPVVIAMMLLGVFLGLAASGAIALAGALFPPDIRSTGLGLAMAMGRTGQMLLPYMMGLGMAQGLTGARVLETSAAFPLLGAAAAYQLSRSLGNTPWRR